MRHNHSRYYWWDNPNFNMTQQIYAGGEVYLESSKTTLKAGVESIQNYIGVRGYSLGLRLVC